MDPRHRRDVTELPIMFAHAIRAGTLPAYHRDPFDRMLVDHASGVGPLAGEAGAVKRDASRKW